MGLMEAIFGGGNRGFDAANDANERNRQLLQSIVLPKYENYSPELYQTEDANYQTTNEDPITKSMQMSALAKMAGLADEGLSDADKAEFQHATDNANQFSRAQTASILNNAQSRGVAGSGLEMLMREQAAQDGAQRAQSAGLETAANGARQRALYNQAFLQGSGNMRDQDYRANANNTNIINQFNQANTQARNRVNQANVDQRNQAFQYNQNLKDKNFQNQMQQTTGQTNANNRQAEIAMAQDEQRRRNNQAIGSLAGAAIGGAAGGWRGAGVGAGIGGMVF